MKFRQWLGKLVSAKSFGPGVDLEGADCEFGKGNCRTILLMAEIHNLMAFMGHVWGLFKV